MKKNLLLYGIFLGALSLSSCSGNTKNREMAGNSMSVESANEVMKYYDTSLKVLKNLVNEDSIKAVLGYIDKTEGTYMLPIVSQPVVSARDTMFVAAPGDYLSQEDRQNLEENYTRLFRSVSAFYENYATYRLYMKDKAYLKDNYAMADKIRKEELLLSIALSEYKQVIFDILTPAVEGAQTVLVPVQKDKK